MDDKDFGKDKHAADLKEQIKDLRERLAFMKEERDECIRGNQWDKFVAFNAMRSYALLGDTKDDKDIF